ncbi:MAG: hypothetical protein IJG52_06150 [Lachnospiraceae bacterium]|nr:hypothetical protein [Lachnospiraceae bacterium]
MVSVKCLYCIGTEEEIAKYRSGGMPEGTIDVYEDKLVFFKKSRTVSMTLGVIGSLLEGKGTEDCTVSKEEVRGCEKAAAPDGSLRHYMVELGDGRKIRILPRGRKSRETEQLLDAFWKTVN